MLTFYRQKQRPDHIDDRYDPEGPVVKEPSRGYGSAKRA
jgi:hypothetical protein